MPPIRGDTRVRSLSSHSLSLPCISLSRRRRHRHRPQPAARIPSCLAAPPQSLLLLLHCQERLGLARAAAPPSSPCVCVVRLRLAHPLLRRLHHRQAKTSSPLCASPASSLPPLLHPLWCSSVGVLGEHQALLPRRRCRLLSRSRPWFLSQDLRILL